MAACLWPCLPVCTIDSMEVVWGGHRGNILPGCAALQTKDQDNEWLVQKLRERFERCVVGMSFQPNSLYGTFIS